MSPKDSKSSSLKDAAKKNPTLLGDPVSLKAEKSDKDPTDQEKEAGSGDGSEKSKKTLKDMAESNPTMLVDPVSLKAETSDTEPTDEDRGAGKTGRKSKL